MINIVDGERRSVSLVDMCAKFAVGVDCIGVSVNSAGMTVHLVDGVSGANQQLIRDMFTHIDSLTVLATASEIVADDTATSVVTTVTLETSMWYLVLLDGEEYARGSVAVVAGVATVTLATDIVGMYRVIFIHEDGSATGEVSVEAVSA